MNKIIIISIILVVGLSIQTDNQCDCSQLLIPQDCQANQSLNCSWDLEKLACITKSITPTVKSNSSYCDNLKQEKCQQEQYCTWYKNSCVPFSSCTAFALTTQEECKTVNVQCTTNGVHCVKIDQCSTYTKQPSCFKNSQMKFCYWNSENKLCEDADTCEKLPASLKSDMECRSALQFCTMKLNGGCEKSPEKCSDHKLESQCAWNLDKSQQCFWNNSSNQCVDRICLNAPTTAITDSYCKTFLSDGSCTVKKGGGCRVRTTCEEADVEDSCKKNKDGQDCFWNESNCLLKICSNALITLTTNDQCNQFIQGCITKSGGGCVENGECIVATIKEACVKNIRGQECFWNSEKNKCLDLKCSNAPFSLTTHDECTTFLSTCTKKVGGGCEDRNCSNAPNTLDSNTLCEEYYPNNKCITKKDGGCIINTICSDIQISQACDKDANNKQCFWDDDNQQCKDKICVNAPTSYNTHDMCQQFLNECTVNKTNDGCVNKTCENSLTQEICDKDLNNQLCTWKGQCYKKQCSYASQTIITNDECFSYSSDCILHNDGYGCTEIVMKCDEILIKEACKFILKVTNGVKSYPECDWKNSQCQNKTCLTAPNTINTTILCDSYLKDCVASNPVSGQIKGCQDLPRNCDQRKSSENCKITRENYPDCIWDNTNGQCLQKSCLTANVQGDNESVTTFTFASCKGYLSQCIPNSTLPNANGCMDQPQSCNGLTVNNCKDEAKINGDCYWNNNVCNDKKCENLGLKTHAACSGELDTCTVTADQQNCMTLANDCSEYSIEDQCKYIVNNDNCIWTNNQCRNSICSDTKNSDQFDSDDECSNFLVKNDKCTVLDRVTNGCIPKQNSCNLYTIQSQCYSTITGGICIWINNTCKSKSLYATGECSTFTGTQSDCELYRLGCTNDSNAVSSTPCILDCTKYQKASLKLSDCNGFHQSCSVNSEGNKCVKNEALCSSYKNSSDCYKASDGYCVYVNSSCKNIATIADCQDVIQSNLDDAKCKVFNQLCTVNKDQDKCQEEKATCDLYDAELNCTISTAQPCIWNVDKCQNIINAKQYDLCSKVVGEVGTITRSYCSSIDSTCIGNSDASGCQPIKDNCSDYLTQQSCSYSSNDYHCIWSNDTCIKPNDPATDCAAITQYQILANSCSAILTGCIGTTLNTKCHQKQSTCSLYQTQETCTRSEESQPICFWDTSSETPSCKSFSAAADCEIITTDSYSQDICTGYSDLCVVGKGKCQVNKPDCSDYDNQDSCTFSGRIK